MEVSSRETLLIETRCCLFTWQQFLCSPRHMGSQGSFDIPRAKLGVIWTLVSAVSVLDEMCHWDCHKAKISLRFVSLFSTCSPQEMSFLWASHGLRRGIGSIVEPFIQFWPVRDKQQTTGDTQAPLPYSGKMRLSMYACLVSGESSQHPKMQGEASGECLYRFRQQNQSVVRHLCNQLAVTNSSSWDSSSVRIAVQRPCLSWLHGQESVPTNHAEALPVLLGHCRGFAHLQDVLVVNTFSGRWVFCKKAS